MSAGSGGSLVSFSRRAAPGVGDVRLRARGWRNAGAVFFMVGVLVQNLVR
jgi:hypothetical protein